LARPTVVETISRRRAIALGRASTWIVEAARTR